MNFDFTNHIEKKQSIIDKEKGFNQSIIDRNHVVNELYDFIADPTLGKPLILLAINRLGEGQVRDIANYVKRRAHIPGRAFVSICKKELSKKGY